MFYLVKKVLFKRRSFHAIHPSRGALKQLSEWRDLVSKLGIQLFALSTASLSENLELELLENGGLRRLLLKKDAKEVKHAISLKKVGELALIGRSDLDTPDILN